jgi:site-specific DNA-cytosine methylase
MFGGQNNMGTKLRALGFTCGIGSMLIGARQAGLQVVGNIEWRKYYHTGTFEHNFKGAFLVHKIDELSKDQTKDLTGIDFIMGHPECGKFSVLNGCNPNVVHGLDTSDIPLFIDAIKMFNPRFFAMDNLGPAFLSVPMSYWMEKLPDYDLFPEWISNYHYGNPAKRRNRFFMIGARKEERFVFIPGEDHAFDNLTCRPFVDDLPINEDLPEINHVHKPLNSITGVPARGNIKNPTRNTMTIGEVKRAFRDWPRGKNFTYINKDGVLKYKIGYGKASKDWSAPVLSGGGAGTDNHFWCDTMEPLTIRERARIQGCPDDFIFLPIRDSLLPKNRDCLIKQTGKFMPVQFCNYISRQVIAHIWGDSFSSTRRRIIKPNKYIDDAKIYYCKHSSYSNPRKTCAYCWIEKSICGGPNNG